MTPLQEAYLNKLHVTAFANLEFFKQNMPEIHLRVIEENPAVSLDISDQGDLTIRHPDGTAQPVAPMLVKAEDGFRRMADPDTRPQMLAFHNMRTVTADPDHGDVQRYHYSKLDAVYPDLIRRHFVEHYPDDRGLHRYPVFGDSKYIPLLIVLGSGVGSHLSRLVLEYDIRHLIIMETDIEAFRISTFFQDYVELSRLAMEKGTDLAFILEPDIEQLSRAFMKVLRGALPPFFIHGAVLFYAMNEGEILEAIKSKISDTLWQMFYGMGYFDDEIISIRHTFQNLSTPQPIYNRSDVLGDDAVAFIIGSGPSLDGLLPILREYKDRAVVFSCGTALAPLYQAGIRPDFHIEMERTSLTYDVLVNTLPTGFLNELHFITTQVMDPAVFGLFKEFRVVIKEADTMGNLLVKLGVANRPPLDTQPTVTNMGMTLALGLGFKRVYLFGVDVGYKESTKHHSRDTAYHSKLPKVDHLRRLLAQPPSMEITVPGNFGGKVLTSHVFEMARLHLAQWVKSNPQAKVYNLNDGALIEDAIALPPVEFQEIHGPCLPSEAGKINTVDCIETAYELLDIDCQQLSEELLNDLDRFANEFSRKLNRKHVSRLDVIDTIVELYHLIRIEIGNGTPSSTMFRGSLLRLLSLGYTAVSIIVDEDEAVAKAMYDFSLISEFLEEARDEVLHAISVTLH